MSLIVVDEDTSPRVADWLTGIGFEAEHARSLGLLRRPDPDYFGLALSRGYAAIVTYDNYADEGVELALVRAMIAGVRVIKLPKPRREPSDVAHDIIRLEAHLDLIRSMMQPDSEIRRIKIWTGDQQTEIETLQDCRDRLAELEAR